MQLSKPSYLTENLLKQFKSSLFGKNSFVFEIFEDPLKLHHEC